MTKTSTYFICSACGYETVKWMGKCPDCGEWNTFTEEVREKRPSTATKSRLAEAVSLVEISEAASARISTGIEEFDRVLGGGMVHGSLILLGGDPGIGKSTLLLQLAHNLAQMKNRVLYLSGEESAQQIRLRSVRLNIHDPAIMLVNEPNLAGLEHYLEEHRPEVVIVDSIQTAYVEGLTSLPGSVTQLRECTAKIMQLAKKTGVIFFLVGHVTKEGALAGPKILEHMVDVVVYFEGEKNYQYRILRGIKNRFGSTDEIGILEMTGQGLLEIKDPAGIFLHDAQQTTVGSAAVVSFEGTRPFLIEVQALVTGSGSAYGRRMASGIDQNRFALIIAVLEKKCGFQLGNRDVYLKVTGGVFLRDPSVDLGVAAAILSSYGDFSLPSGTAFSGELSLSGEIRLAPFLNARIKEVEKMGFQRMVLPTGGHREGSNEPTHLEIVEIANISDLYEWLAK